MPPSAWRPSGLSFPARDDVEVQVIDGLPGRSAVELADHQAVRRQGFLDSAGHFLHLQHVLAKKVRRHVEEVPRLEPASE
jgi:hypothetical protein